MPYDPLLTRKTVLLFKEETVFGEDASPDASNNALLVEEAAWSLDVKMIERNFYVAHLSPQAKLAGRKLGTISFSHEVRGNGLAQTSLGNLPKLGQLMKSCGFNAVNVGSTATDRIQPLVAQDGNVGAMTVSRSGTLTNTQPAVYTIVCTGAGGSGVAEVSITCNNADVNDTPQEDVVLTNATPVDLDGCGGTITPTISSALAVGDTWTVTVLPAGNALVPVSTGYKSGTLKLYLDGKLHVLYGAMGTFSISAEAGGRAVAQFTFTGAYGGTTDAALPANPVLEGTMVPLVERSLLTWGGNSRVASAGWTFDVASTLAERMDVNAAEGLIGMITTARATKGGFTPEATLEADAPFWGSMANGFRKSFFARVGRTAGNAFVLDAPAVQTDTLGYADRDGLRTYDVGMTFTQGSVGDDEVKFMFH